MESDKRRIRKLKRTIKKSGQKALRRRLDRELRENPEGAHQSGADFGRDSSTGFNGLDEDRTRRRPGDVG
jgi:hypothetical protein